MIRQAEEMARPIASLHVLEGDVIYRLAARERVADVAQHLEARRPDINLGRGDFQRPHQPPGVLLGAVAGGEGRHGVGEHVLPRQAQAIHRPAGDDQRLRRIQPPGDADHQLRNARGAQALLQPVDLDVIRLVAAFVALGRVVRDVGETFDKASQRDGRLVRDDRLKAHAAEVRQRLAMLNGAVAVAGHPHALLAQAIEIDVGGDKLLALGEALGLGEQCRVLVNHRVAVPREISRGFARARCGIHVGRDASPRLAGA